MSINYSRKTTSLVDVSNGPLAGNGQAVDALTYEPFFGLTEKPFSLDADPRFLYASPTHDATRKGLLAGIRRREGLLVLTGEIGTGKTTLCRTVLRELGRNTWSSLVPDPFAAREDLLKMLLIDFGVLSIHDMTEGNLRHASRTELGYLLSDFLNTLSRDDYAVVIIDEAQNLSLPLIEETRVLFDSFGAKGRLQILFVGQPELHAKLKLPEMRQVDQRVCGYYRLAAMNAEAVAGYIEHRLYVAGGDPERVLFPPAMVEALHKRTGGVPRLINRVCDRALQLAYEQRADAVHQEVFDAALIEVGAVTLSPTWDSIIFAEGRATSAASAPPAPFPTPAPEPIPAPVSSAPVSAAPANSAVAIPAPAKSVPANPESANPVLASPAVLIQSIPSHGMDCFEKEIEPQESDSGRELDFDRDVDEWVQKDLATPSRARSPLFEGLDELPPAPAASSAAPRAPASTRTTSTRVRIDWPRDVRSETYIQKFMRTWLRRGAFALGVFIAANILFAGAVTLQRDLGRPDMPPLPASPAKLLPGVELPEVIGEPSVGVVFVGDDASSVEAGVGTP